MVSIPALVSLLLLYITTMYMCKPEGDIFSAVSHMEPLVDIERRLVKIAREYLNKEKLKLNGLKQFAQSVEEAMELSKDEPIKYLGNPINSYLIIKRFTSGWSELGDRLTIEDEKLDDIKVLLKANEMYLPVEGRDLHGATNAILRLQDTFQLSAYELAEGKIQGTSRQAHQLTAQDCLDIANSAHGQKRYVRMIGWLKEAERIVNDPFSQHRLGNASKLEVYEFLSWGNYLSNNLSEALQYTELVLEIDSVNENAIKNREFFRFYEKENTEQWLTPEQWDYKEEVKNDKMYENGTFVKLCTGTTKPLKLKSVSSLVCFYRNTAPRNILKPIKTTRVHDNPEVYIFHDVIRDTELNKMKAIAKPRLEHARVVDPEDNTFHEALYRVAKTMFLNLQMREDYLLNEKLNDWLSDITGLDMETAEALQEKGTSQDVDVKNQMNNYGLGGQYEFHHDHGLFPGQLLYDHEDGNRLATILLYLSDVERGGQTVFTKIGLSVPPKKGDAVFWYNLYKNGTGIWDTEHASCPVISGSKWVANKWVHERGNEFKRRCSLNRLD